MTSTFRAPVNSKNTNALTAAAAAGFAAAFAQMVFLRELLALFSGFELAAGLFLAFWLLWTALGSRLAAGATHRFTPGLLLLMLALLLPATLLLLRASRPLWSVPLGELPGLGVMLAVCALVPGLFCLCSGALFAVCWAQKATERPMRVYLAEALGSGLAGLVLFFVLLPLQSALQSVLLVACLLLALACRQLLPQMRLLPPLLLLLLFILATAAGAPLERLSRTWQWGEQYVTGQDSPYQSLAVCRQAEQLSLFSDGSWLFSVPDPLSTEFALEPVLLLHPHPQSLLLVGGNPLELPAQARMHPQLETITMVEQDPAIPALLRKALHVFPGQTASFADPLAQDPAVLLRTPGPQYDVILLQLGEPVNAGRNRYYTREFFQAAAGRLAPGGLLSFAAPGAPEAVGPVQARMLCSLNATLRAVFPMVLALPGEQIRFVASTDVGYAAVRTGALLQRLKQQSAPARFFRAHNVRELFNPFKRSYLQNLFAAAPAPVNQDFHPACYLDSLLAWARQLDQRLFAVLDALSHTGESVLWLVVILAGLLLVCVPPACKTAGLPLAAESAVALTGGCLMSFQFFLLLFFQILAGSLFSRLALLVAASMAGLALGSWLAPRKGAALGALIRTQAALCLLLAGTGPFFNLLHSLTPPPAANLSLCVCLVLALAGGVLGGLHFGLASRLLAENGQHPARLGGRLYALDLAGASAGSLLVSLLLLPLYGLQPVLLAAALLCAASLCGLALAGSALKKINTID